MPFTPSRLSPGTRKIGLLGGSFNPAHGGHLAMSLIALKRLRLDEVWWLVSPQNPLKPSHDMAPLAERLAKAKSLARHPRIVVTDIERQLGTRYTVDTLLALKRRYPRARFVWLMGADNMRQVARWHAWPKLFELAPVAVFRRPAYAAGRKRGKAAQRFDSGWKPGRRGAKLASSRTPAWLVLEHPMNTLSATAIRKDQPTWHKVKRRPA